MHEVAEYTYCCQVLAVNRHAAWRLFEQYAATYLQTTLNKQKWGSLWNQVGHKSGNAFCYSVVLLSTFQSGYENKNILRRVVCGCSTWSLVLISAVKRSVLTRATQIWGARSPGVLNFVLRLLEFWKMFERLFLTEENIWTSDGLGKWTV
jgi:hypothetical protein